jgi:hypothetical protein
MVSMWRHKFNIENMVATGNRGEKKHIQLLTMG